MLKERQKLEGNPKGILVCIDLYEWSLPAKHPHREAIFVCDMDSGKEFAASFPLEEVAELLHKGIFVKIFDENCERRNIIFEPPISGYTIMADGYFGRPEIPVEYHALSSFSEIQIQQFESALAELINNDDCSIGISS